MRVALDVRPLQSPSRQRGLGTYTRELLRAYLESRRPVTPLAWEGIPLELPAPSQEAPFLLPPPRPRQLGWLRDQLLLGSRFQDLARQVDLIHFTSPFELDLGWPGLHPGIPQVVTVHDLMAVTRASTLLTGRRRLLAPVYRWQAARLAGVEGLLADSHHTAREISRLLPAPPPTQVVHLGVSPHFQPPPPEAVAALKARLALPDRYLLYLGGLSANKNVDRLLEAAGPTLPAGDEPLPELVIAGAAPPGVRAALQARHPGRRARWPGPIPEADLPALYAGATAFVFPSLEEGFGLPVLEAMACGAPVACSSSSSLPEVAGEAALTFDPEDPRAMAAALTRLSRDPGLREELRRRGVARAATFRWEETARQTWAFYEETSARRQGS